MYKVTLNWKPAGQLEEKDLLLKAILNWARTRIYEQLCLSEILKLMVSFLIDVFALGERLCSRPMSMHSDARNVASAGYRSKLLIG